MTQVSKIIALAQKFLDRAGGSSYTVDINRVYFINKYSSRLEKAAFNVAANPLFSNNGKIDAKTVKSLCAFCKDEKKE